MAKCKWEGCLKHRATGADFCQAHADEALARLFPAHSRHGERFPIKAKHAAPRPR